MKPLSPDVNLQIFKGTKEMLCILYNLDIVREFAAALSNASESILMLTKQVGFLSDRHENVLGPYKDLLDDALKSIAENAEALAEPAQNCAEFYEAILMIHETDRISERFLKSDN